MVIKLTGKKARTAILFLTLFLIAHVFITAFPVSEVIKQEKYSKNYIKNNFMNYDGILKRYICDVYFYMSDNDAYLKSAITEERIDQFLNNSNNFYENDYRYLGSELQIQPKDRVDAIKLLEEIRKYYKSQLTITENNFRIYSGLEYYFNDKDNNVFTNIDGNVDDYIKDKSLYYFNINSDNIKFNDGHVMGFDPRYIINGYIIIPKVLPMNSEIYKFLDKLNSERIEGIMELSIFAIEVVSLIILISLVIKKKLNLEFEQNSNKIMKCYVGVKFEIKILIVLVIAYSLSELSRNYYNLHAMIKIIFIIYFTLFLRFVIYILMKLSKDRLVSEIRNSIIFNFYSSLKFVKDLNKNLNKLYFKIFFNICTIIIIGVIIVDLLTMKGYSGNFRNYYDYTDIYMYSNSLKLKIIIVLIIFFIAPLLTYMIKKFLIIHNLIKAIENISINDLENNLNIKENNELFNAYESIRNIKASIESLVEERLKSERLKTELITNVSHDLKTPLTSIINYVDLMKKDNLSEEDYKSYLEIIDKKSKRLKILIEDLFEASKLNSRDIELNKEKVDLVSLIKQTLGEFEKQIEDSELELILKLPDEKVYLELDGKKIWRVFENILNNIFKYSQKNTRVYIELIEDEKSIMVITKNISAYQLNINPEELFEKFKRGDEARNTEGSGLGLSIARGIMELHGGEMKIEVDGDLFKNILIFK